MGLAAFVMSLVLIRLSLPTSPRKVEIIAGRQSGITFLAYTNSARGNRQAVFTFENRLGSELDIAPEVESRPAAGWPALGPLDASRRVASGKGAPWVPTGAVVTIEVLVPTNAEAWRLNLAYRRRSVLDRVTTAANKSEVGVLRRIVPERHLSTADGFILTEEFTR